MIMKKELRKKILNQRSQPFLERETQTQKIEQKRFNLPELVKAKTVFCYAAYRGEVETRPLIVALLKAGKTVCVPYLTSKKPPMAAKQLLNVRELTPGVFGIDTSPDSAPFISMEQIDAAVIPGAAFDKKGNRLGYGGGFYDEFLARTRPDCVKIAPAFPFQIVPDLKPDEWDIPVDFIVTPDEVVRC